MRKKSEIIFLIFLIIGIAISIYRNSLSRISFNDDELNIMFFPVGKADSILIVNGEYAALIDGGLESDAEDICSYLKELGIRRLKYIISTHSDSDHIGGLYTILNNMNVDYIITSCHAMQNDDYIRLIKKADRRGIPVIQAKAEDTFILGEAVFTVLSPQEDINGDDFETESANSNAAYEDMQKKYYNNLSLVLRIDYGKNSAVFMGDALREAQEEIINKDYRVKTDIIKISHHGFEDGISEEFLNKAGAEYAIITRQDTQAEGRDKQLYDILEKTGTKAVVTGEKNVTFVTFKDGDIYIKQE